MERHSFLDETGAELHSCWHERREEFLYFVECKDKTLLSFGNPDLRCLHDVISSINVYKTANVSWKL